MTLHYVFNNQAIIDKLSDINAGNVYLNLFPSARPQRHFAAGMRYSQEQKMQCYAGGKYIVLQEFKICLN